MKTETLKSIHIKRFLKKQKIATISDLSKVLGSEVRMTTFRKLKELSYLSSYSHGGKYYTLREIANFNETGLWNVKGVRFAEQGTLLETAKQRIHVSKNGCSSMELESKLGVPVKDSLLLLQRRGEVSREKWDGIYIYYAPASQKKREQLLTRQKRCRPLGISGRGLSEEPLSEELKASMILFFSHLDEKNRRLYAGLESLKLGHGGDKNLAEFLNMNVGTVSKGRQELLDRYFEKEGVRKSGGGRKEVKKKRQKSLNTSKH